MLNRVNIARFGSRVYYIAAISISLLWKNPDVDKICKVSRAEARFIVHQNRLAIVIRSVSPSEITAVSLMQLDRLSREERSSGSVALIRVVVPRMICLRKPGDRFSSGRG